MPQLFRSTQPLRLIFVVALVLACERSQAQVHYFGFVDDVHPIRLSIYPQGDTGRLWLGSATESFALRGQFNAVSGTLAGVDTALHLDFQLDQQELIGNIRFGDGRAQQVLAKAYQGYLVQLDIQVQQDKRRIPVEFVGFISKKLGQTPEIDSTTFVKTQDAFTPDFLSGCGSDKWISAWSTADQAYRLMLATLPAGQLRGSLYVASINATFAAAGTRQGRELQLELTRSDGSKFGSFQAMADSSSVDLERLSAKLDLQGSEQQLRLAVSERIPLGCRQASGRFDLMMPMAPPSEALPSAPPPAGEVTLQQMATQTWEELLSQAATLGTGWFEPTRLDAEVLSGWIHIQTDTRHLSYPLNLNRRSNYLIGEKLFQVGPRRERQHKLSRQFKLSAEAHPLHHDKAFKAWLANQKLTEVALAKEGLIYSTERHPVFGRLVWIEPWNELVPELAAATAWLHQ